MICQNNEVDHAQNCVIFVLDHTDCGQGYTKLKLFMNSTVREVLHKEGTTVIDMTEETHEGNFLSTKKIIDFYLSYLGNSNVPLMFTDMDHVLLQFLKENMISATN